MFSIFPKIIFILPNIYESINGVSTKYIKFIEYLIKAQYELTLIIPFINNENFENILTKLEKYKNVKLIKANGFLIPFYKEIKIPIINKSLIEKEIKNKNEIIIFNGEFIWLYTLLKKLKKKYKNIKLYPNMHTDYINYADNYYNNSISTSASTSASTSSFFDLSFLKKWNITSVFNYTDFYLQEKIFSGIIVTGEQLKKKYINFTDTVFNANEIDLSIFKSYKIDQYDSNYNIIFCGRISKEKNIEDVLECCMILYQDSKLNKNSQNSQNNQFNLHIIGDGPHLNNLKALIETKYYIIKDNIIFYGALSHEDIYKLYHSLDNRIFLFTSLSETFGKTPMEACATGIPIFIKKCELSDNLYIHKKNAFIFDTSSDFVDNFKIFLDMDILDKNAIITNGINNVQKYEQSKIFNDWIYFLINGHLNKTSIINFFDIFTFHGLTKMINCSGSILAD